MKLPFKILLFSESIILFAGALFGPIYAIFVEEIGGDILDASTAFAIFSITSGVVVFLISRMEDRIKEQELLVVVGYAIIGLGYFGYLFVQTPLHLFLLQAFIGVGIALYLPASDAMYSKHLDYTHAASNWGMWEGMNRLVLGVGALAGGLIVSAFGFPILFILMGIVCLASALFIFLLPRRVL